MSISLNTRNPNEPGKRTVGALFGRARRYLGPYQALSGNHDLALLYGGQVVSSLGDWLYITVVVVLAYTLTGSAFIAGALTFVRLLPYIFFLPLAGVLADRFDRKRLMIVADLGRASCMLGLLLVHSRGTVWIAFPLVFVSTCLFSLFRPALGATIPAVAGSSEDLVKANSLMSQVDSLSILLGPALGGLLLLAGIERGAFAINAVTYVVSTLTLLHLHLPSRTQQDRSPSDRWIDEVLAGWRFIRRERRGRLEAVTLTTAAGSCFNGAIWTLVIIMAEGVWRLGGQGAGFLSACMGAGALTGTLIIGAITRRLPVGRCYTLAMVGTILTIMLLGLSPAGLLPFVVIALYGLFDGLNQVIGTTMVQEGTPDELLGRVFATFEAIAISGLLIGALAVGLLSSRIGARATTAGFALVPLAALLVYGSRFNDAGSTAGATAPEATSPRAAAELADSSIG